MCRCELGANNTLPRLGEIAVEKNLRFTQQWAQFFSTIASGVSLNTVYAMTAPSGVALSNSNFSVYTTGNLTFGNITFSGSSPAALSNFTLSGLPTNLNGLFIVGLYQLTGIQSGETIVGVVRNGTLYLYIQSPTSYKQITLNNLSPSFSISGFLFGLVG